MLEALLEGEAQPEEIAQFAQRAAKRKIPEIIAVLEGHRMDEQIVAKIAALGYQAPMGIVTDGSWSSG